LGLRRRWGTHRQDFFTKTHDYYKQYIEANLRQRKARYIADKEALKKYDADNKSSNGIL
jgi:hypothetical protein